MEDPTVRWFQYVLHNQAGFDEVCRIHHNGGNHACETPSHDGAPLGNMTQVIHEEYDKPRGKGGKAQGNQLQIALKDSTLLIFSSIKVFYKVKMTILIY